jgi:hypothetical protein
MTFVYIQPSSRPRSSLTCHRCRAQSSTNICLSDVCLSGLFASSMNAMSASSQLTVGRISVHSLYIICRVPARKPWRSQWAADEDAFPAKKTTSCCRQTAAGHRKRQTVACPVAPRGTNRQTDDDKLHRRKRLGYFGSARLLAGFAVAI